MSESLVVMCTPGVGHFQVLLPVIQGLCARGHVVHVLTHPDYRAKVELVGGRFVDLFTQYPIEAADSTSLPVPSRYVSFAGVHAERLTREIAALEPALMVYETYSVVAPIVARALGIPYVNVSPNHAPVPSRVAAALRQDPRVATSAECWAAVERLREVHGLAGANPFMYVETVSPHLNLYPEPLPFLDDDDRRALEPVAFFGSLTPTLQDDPMTGVFRRERGRLRLYVAFGTVVWWYFASAARAALTAIASDTAQLGVEVVVGLGGHCLDAATRTALARPDIRVLEYANQWAALREADVFVTHNGLNSTHEAIFHEVPMISYPLFGDQPALARRCRDLGLATSLADGPRAPVAAGALRAALERLRDDRVGFAARLAMARAWEIQTIAGREAVLDRMLALIGTGSGVAP